MNQTRPPLSSSTVETKLTRSVEEAAAVIRKGGIVAFPTETVYGLGANVFDRAAVRRIFDAKGRPSDNPLIAHISDLQQLALLAQSIPPVAEKLISTFFPGPLTVVLKKRSEVPVEATAGLDTIGVRMPAGQLAHDFLVKCGVPVVAPSANLSGRPSPTTWEAVAEDLAGAIECILQGDQTEIGLESTVIDCSDGTAFLLRAGSISEADIKKVLPNLQIGVNASQPRSPGMKHKHYSPTATVKIVDSPTEISGDHTSAYIGLDIPTTKFALARTCANVTVYAHSLFEFLRECDRDGLKTIYCQRVDTAGVGSALMDRIERAARG